MCTSYLAFLFIAAWMLESESCKSSINGEGEGEFRKEIFFHLRGCTFLGPHFENMQGMFLKVNLTNYVFKHSPKEQGNILLIFSRLLNCILFLLRSDDCSTSAPLMFSGAWQKGQGCFFLQLSLFLWGQVLRMCWSVSKFIFFGMELHDSVCVYFGVKTHSILHFHLNATVTCDLCVATWPKYPPPLQSEILIWSNDFAQNVAPLND